MARTLRRRFLASVVCALLVFCGSFVVVTYSTWAGRGQQRVLSDKAFIDEAEFEAAKRVQSMQAPGTARPAGLSPLGSLQPTWEVGAQKRGLTI
ncbi:MAG: hypothetical protein DMF50_13030, partial [Acidobacteria bacterium]